MEAKSNLTHPQYRTVALIIIGLFFHFNEGCYGGRFGSRIKRRRRKSDEELGRRRRRATVCSYNVLRWVRSCDRRRISSVDSSPCTPTRVGRRHLRHRLIFRTTSHNPYRGDGWLRMGWRKSEAKRGWSTSTRIRPISVTRASEELKKTNTLKSQMSDRFRHLSQFRSENIKTNTPYLSKIDYIYTKSW